MNARQTEERKKKGEGQGGSGNFFTASSLSATDDPQRIGPGSQLQLSFSRSEGLCLISAKVI